MTNENKAFIYLGWDCLVNKINGNWHYCISYPNGAWKTQGNAFSEYDAIISVFRACDSLGECKE